MTALLEVVLLDGQVVSLTILARRLPSEENRDLSLVLDKGLPGSRLAATESFWKEGGPPLDFAECEWE